ncbi:MAG: phage tail protein [Prevotella sp.]|jgi:hypothetical protein|nr:phage tail protein [Prevotella sp.]
MKKYIIITATLCLLSLAGKAQPIYNSGAGFSYAAVLHNLQGALLQNETLSLRASIYSSNNNAPDSLMYKEEHSVTTDELGVARLQVGKGKVADDSPAAEYKYCLPTGWLRIEALQADGQWTEISTREISTPLLAEATASILAGIGLIVAYGGEDVPDGWLECDGRAVNRADYPALFAKLGKTGTPATFTLPDMRALFLRGFDNNNNYGGLLERKRGGVKEHSHSYTAFGMSTGIASSSLKAYGELIKNVGLDRTGALSSSYMHPKSAIVKYIIKAR